MYEFICEVSLEKESNSIISTWAYTELEAFDNLILMDDVFDIKKKQQRRIAKRAFSKTFVDYQNNCNLANSKATFENGLLKITIPNNTAEVPIKIDIK